MQSIRIPIHTGVELALDVEHRPSGRTVVFLHATGFTRGVWRPVARTLANESTFAVDLRGHGGSSKPPTPYTWASLVEDVVALAETLDWRDIVLCGHSVGGSTAVEVAATIPDRVAALVLTEPPLNPPATGPAQLDPEALVTMTLKRRSHWSSRDEAEAHLSSKSPYRHWDPEVLSGFLAAGLHDLADGSCELACPPEIEASVFVEAIHSRAWERLPDVTCPTWLLRATGDQGMASTTSPETIDRIRHGRETVIEGSGHFLPLEQPSLVSELIREALAATSGGATTSEDQVKPSRHV